MSEFVTRELTIEEWDKLLTVPPFKELGKLPDPNHARVVGIFNSENELKGYWYIFDAVHVEPLWIDEEFRKIPSVAKSLLSGVKDILAQRNIPIAFAIIRTEDFTTHVPMAQRIGFKPLPGNLFYMSPHNEIIENLVNPPKEG